MTSAVPAAPAPQSHAPPHAPSALASRRAALMEALPDGAIILTAAHAAPRNNDVEHEFRQDSTFWYFVGLEEPDAVALLRPGSDAPYILFVNPYDPQFEIWVGERVGVEGAKAKLGADDAFDVNDLEDKLPELLAESSTLHYALGSDARMDALVGKLATGRRRSGQRDGGFLRGVVDPTYAAHTMRAIKSPAELAAMQSAIDVTAQGFERAMRATRAGLCEYHVQTELEGEFRRLGSRRNGYPSIVASGENACVLHYTKNRRQMLDGDLLLVDAGAEADYYSADVTRVWPVGGAFTPQQREVYEIVLAAQRAGIDAIAPGAAVKDVHAAALRALTQGLIDLGALEGDVDGLIEAKRYLPYYMHGTSHWLGLDVHDAGLYATGEESTLLREGMVLTVEPGLYFGRHAPDAPERLRGVGVRIEDDVAVTADGRRVMSRAIPKEAAAIECIVGSA